MLNFNHNTPKTVPIQLIQGVLTFVVLTLPLYWAGYHNGAIPTFGVAIAIALGSLGAFTVMSNGVVPVVREELQAFSLKRMAVWLILMFLGSLIYAGLVLREPGGETLYGLVLSNQYGDAFKPLSHILYGAGIWTFGQVLMIAHGVVVEAQTSGKVSSGPLHHLRVRSGLRALPLVVLGILALIPKVSLIVLPLMLIGMIHLRDELLRVRTSKYLR